MQDFLAGDQAATEDGDRSHQAIEPATKDAAHISQAKEDTRFNQAKEDTRFNQAKEDMRFSQGDVHVSVVDAESCGTDTVSNSDAGQDRLQSLEDTGSNSVKEDRMVPENQESHMNRTHEDRSDVQQIAQASYPKADVVSGYVKETEENECVQWNGSAELAATSQLLEVLEEESVQRQVCC